MRLHELARELGRTSRDLIAELRAAGEWVTSHQSSVPEPVVRRYLPGGPSRRPRPRSADRSPAPVPALVERPVWRLRRRPGPAQITARQPVILYGDDYDPYDLQFEPTLTTRDVAELHRVTLATVRQWVARGYITPTGKLGPSNLFDADQVRTAVQGIHARRKGTGIPPATTGYVIALTPADRIPPKYHDAIVTPSEAARLVGVSPATIRAWLHRGHITRLSSSTSRAVDLRLGDVVAAARERHLPRPLPRTRPLI